MSDDSGSIPRVVFTIAHLAPDDLRELIRAELVAGLAKDREMRKLELMASLRADRAPKLSFAARLALAWRVLSGAARHAKEGSQ